ncbi:VOC family protein [Streptomyces sp. TRM66268-LWL]|uniref:VOC family protein n=1 Tax=Streptomyces polyasparticus TaxID=2767826 RepID=A0ABR7SNU5_9ACTN|nr:VOC family protein [Streptomyces polyasparticus]
MTSRIRHITIDSHNPYSQAQFWAEALGGKLSDEDNPGDPEAIVEHAGDTILFVTVPEGKTIKNRVHLDIQPTDRTRDEEVERLIALGATLASDMRRPNGRGWQTLCDPEGNEFCVEPSQAEIDRIRAAQADS